MKKRKSAKEQVEEIEMERFMLYLEGFLYSGGIVLTKQKIMSTTFGVKIPSTGEIEPIARRVGIGNGKVSMWFTNPLAELLPNDTEVEAMDNGQQGIFTIGDIKEKIKE